MRKERTTGYGWGFLLLAVMIAVLAVLNICIGSVSIPLRETIRTLLGKGSDPVWTDILYSLRLPRTVAAMVLGGGLALSGYLLQTFFHNPIAGPYLLGISSGAKLMVALVLVALTGQALKITSMTLILAAFAGAMMAMGFVLLMARLIDHMAVLIIAGIMIGYICSAITDFVITFAADEEIVNLHNWSKGSFSGIGWNDVQILTVVILAASVAVIFLAKPISAYEMGTDYARSVGVNMKMFRMMLVLLSSILSACVTAFAGPISFVGIAVPHLIRNLFGTSRPQIIIPGCFLGGGAFCLLCDLLARTLFAPTEMSISTVTAFFGAPVVIAILIRRHRGVQS